MKILNEISEQDFLGKRKKLLLDWFEKQLLIKKQENRVHFIMVTILTIIASVLIFWLFDELRDKPFAFIYVPVLAFLALFLNIPFGEFCKHPSKNDADELRRAIEKLSTCREGELFDTILLLEDCFQPRIYGIPCRCINYMLRIASSDVLHIDKEQDYIFTCSFDCVVKKISFPSRYIKVEERTDIDSDVLKFTEHGMFYQKKYVAPTQTSK